MLPDADTAAALYEATAEDAARFGLPAYEVSNYAAPGAESRHNLTYWRYGDYAGIGPGAHGRITLDGAVLATRRHRAPGALGRARRAPRPWHDPAKPPLSAVERAREMLLMGLRLNEGVEAERFAQRTGMALDDAIDPDIRDRAVAEGYLHRDDGRLCATPAGRLRLDALLAALLR